MNTDVIIIGGGIAGLATARELMESGARVTIVERDVCGREASWAGGGILSPLLPWDYSAPVTELAQFSNRLFPAFIESLLTETGVDPEYLPGGMLVLPGVATESEAGNKVFSGAAEEWCSSHQFPVEHVNSQKIAPAIANDDPALWLPSVCQVRNPRLLKALIRSSQLKGATLIEHTSVRELKIANGMIESAITNRGDKFSADNYVVTAGAWSRELLGEHALKLDIGPIRGQILLFKAPPGLLKPIMLQEHDKFYLIPRRDGHILAGSTLEEAGFDKSSTEDARKMLLAKAHAILPQLTEEAIVGQWAGLRPGSPNNIPIIDGHPFIHNLYINSGHYRYGVTMAPGSARLLSNIILDRPQPIDVMPYRWPQ